MLLKTIYSFNGEKDIVGENERRLVTSIFLIFPVCFLKTFLFLHGVGSRYCEVQG